MTAVFPGCSTPITRICIHRPWAEVWRWGGGGVGCCGPAESPAEYVIEQGEMLTPQYFDGLAAEVDEVLQETGQVGHTEYTRCLQEACELERHSV